MSKCWRVFCRHLPISCGRSKLFANLLNNLHHNVTDRAAGHVQVPRRSQAIPQRPVGYAASFRLPRSGCRRPPKRTATESPASRLASTGSASRSSALTPSRSAASSGEVVPCMEEHFPSPPPSARTITPPHMSAVGRTERGYPFARPVVRRVIATVNRLQSITLTVTRTKRPRFAKRRRNKRLDPVWNVCSTRAQGRSRHYTVQASD